MVVCRKGEPTTDCQYYGSYHRYRYKRDSGSPHVGYLVYSLLCHELKIGWAGFLLRVLVKSPRSRTINE